LFCLITNTSKSPKKLPTIRWLSSRTAGMTGQSEQGEPSAWLMWMDTDGDEELAAGAGS
jgi:hypothetical protein